MPRWLTTTQFEALYQITPNVQARMIKDGKLVAIRSGTNSKLSTYRILDPGPEYVAVYSGNPLHFPFIRISEAAAMMGLKPRHIKYAQERGFMRRATKELPHFSFAEIELAYRRLHGYKTIRPEVVKHGIALLEKATEHKIELPPEVKPLVLPPPKPVPLDRFGTNTRKWSKAGHNPLWCRGNYHGDEPIEICWPCIEYAFDKLLELETIKAASAKTRQKRA